MAAGCRPRPCTRRLVAAEDCVSAVVFGPNGSGKSTGLIVPNVLEWDGPVVMTTTKPQDVSLVLARRRGLGPVWVVAPAGCPGVATACWSPVDYATDAEAADRMAEWLCEASGLSADPRPRAWVLQARKLIKPLLLAAHESRGGIEAFVRWIYDGQAAAEEVKAILGEAGCSAHMGMAVMGIKRDLLVNAWYTGGVDVIDFTQPTSCGRSRTTTRP